MEPQLKQAILAAYENYDRETTIANFKVACILGIVLMPAGALLDWFVYPERVWDFLRLRLLCSSLIGLFLAFMLTRLGRRFYRFCGVTLLMLPTFFMSVMIYQTEGSRSPYYAGLNLVVLMLGFVLHWTFRESLLAVTLVLGMYLAACLAHGAVWMSGIFFNNLYFLVLTGIIVVTGSYFLGVLRFQEFASRYELDHSKRQLEENNRKLLELDQLKSRFFANVSHELRTPLTLMLAPLEKLQRQPGVAADERTRVLLQTMQVNGMRLLKLINDLLELVRLDSGTIPVRREAIEVGEFLRGLANAARHLAEERRLTLETTVAEGLGQVMADRDKLEKIILNLQFNALKFTPPGGRVEIRAARADNEWMIQVMDTGVGIAEKDLPNVFSRFWQADNTSRRKYQGVGIGLALVKELTEVQGGTVAVASQEGKGTTFTVRLPYLPAPASGPAPEPTSAEEVKPAVAAVTDGASPTDPGWLANLYRRAELLPVLPQPQLEMAASPAVQPLPVAILIADDEPDMRRFLKLQFQDYYRIYEAADGQEAVDQAGRVLPDLILLDMMMPIKDGLQVCRELRAQPATRTIPIILITARVDEDTKLSVLAAGASDFLSKPFSTTELYVRVKNLVESHRYEKRLAEQNAQLERAITQIKEAEAQLVQSEKLASLGRMSAGIIHEINNPLNYAKTGLYSLRQHLPELPPEKRAGLEDLLNEIEDGVNRVKNIVLDLGPFAREQAAFYDLQPLAPMVEAALRFLSHEWKNGIKVEKEIPAELTAWTSQARVIQVLVNLLQNSLDALKHKDFGAGQPTIRIRGWEAGGRCFLAVRDNGPGIQPEILPKVFEPFFTTKEVGAGIGLGLNICYRIMQDHGGKITVDSQPGEYCEFTLEFRTAAPPASA